MHIQLEALIAFTKTSQYMLFYLIKDSVKLRECLWCFLSNDIVSTSQ